jgi:hypothetical protein
MYTIPLTVLHITKNSSDTTITSIYYDCSRYIIDFDPHYLHKPIYFLSHENSLPWTWPKLFPGLESVRILFYFLFECVESSRSRISFFFELSTKKLSNFAQTHPVTFWILSLWHSLWLRVLEIKYQVDCQK